MTVKSFFIKGDLIPVTSILKVRMSQMGGELDHDVHLVNSSVYHLNTGNENDLRLINNIREYLEQPILERIEGKLKIKTRIGTTCIGTN